MNWKSLFHQPGKLTVSHLARAGIPHISPRPHTYCVRRTRHQDRYADRNTMISDDDLYRLAIFLGSVAMILIVLYHFFEVNSQEDNTLAQKAPRTTPAQTPAQTPAAAAKPPPATK
ncbi:Oligosaccaryltransferase-domain-containing protein [Nemania serpens]|nr:Oligosaccaryltransferase-domain-containing protein [Nemania serpens]